MKNNTLILIIVGLLILGGIFFITSPSNKDSMEKETTESVVKESEVMKEEDKAMEEDKMTDTEETEKKEEDAMEADSMEDTTMEETYTLADIAEHPEEGDCWFAINGKVYDVSEYDLDKHPGERALLEGCGLDATTLFETRPMGSGTPHSDKARGFLENWYIGDLAE